MSRTYSIACVQCRKHLWIAQIGAGTPTLYSGQPKTMDALRDFLFEHQGHPLVFDDNVSGVIADMDEIDADA
jgi:hypothetical protein